MDSLDLPKLTKHITDLSGILSSGEIETLSRLFVEHETRTTEQVVTLLFPHRQGHDLLEIGLKVFNENAIGQKDLNNGLLLIIATEEKKLRIIVGKGLEIKYTEMICRDIIENHLRPLLNTGNFVIVSTILIGGFFFSLSKISHIDCRETYRDQDKVSTYCARNLLGKTYEYIDTQYTESYKALHPEQFGKSSNSSNGGSSSSFGGGGGSSNGGGYGD